MTCLSLVSARAECVDPSPDQLGRLGDGANVTSQFFMEASREMPIKLLPRRALASVHFLANLAAAGMLCPRPHNRVLAHLEVGANDKHLRHFVVFNELSFHMAHSQVSLLVKFGWCDSGADPCSAANIYLPPRFSA